MQVERPVEFPEAFIPIFDEANPNYNKRYIIYYGGRGSGKSINFAKALLLKGEKQPRRILCCREYQNSIGDSVIKTLEDEIDILNMRHFYEVQNNGIYGKNGTEFIFKGLKNNIQSIKSIPGITDAWIEEGQSTSERSLDILIPTIRAENSQIYISMNPDLDDDPAYERFVLNPPKDSYVRKVNFDDNPFLPEVLRNEMIEMRDNNPDKFNNVWLGFPLSMNEGSIYGKWMQDAETENRITTVPYNPSLPVITSWDLGYADMTVIWFAQIAGKEPRLIDFHMASGASLDSYVKLVKEKPYNYSMHVLPHDAGANSIRTGTTMAQQLANMGLGQIDKTITVLPIDSIETGHELVRALLPQLWIDKDKCAEGIKGLKKYRYEWDEDRKRYKQKPFHDINMDIADSARYLATYLASLKSTVVKTPALSYNWGGVQSWMG